MRAAIGSLKYRSFLQKEKQYEKPETAFLNYEPYYTPIVNQNAYRNKNVRFNKQMVGRAVDNLIDGTSLPLGLNQEGSISLSRLTNKSNIFNALQNTQKMDINTYFNHLNRIVNQYTEYN